MLTFGVAEAYPLAEIALRAMVEIMLHERQGPHRDRRVRGRIPGVEAQHCHLQHIQRLEAGQEGSLRPQEDQHVQQGAPGPRGGCLPPSARCRGLGDKWSSPAAQQSHPRTRAAPDTIGRKARFAHLVAPLADGPRRPGMAVLLRPRCSAGWARWIDV